MLVHFRVYIWRWISKRYIYSQRVINKTSKIQSELPDHFSKKTKLGFKISPKIGIINKTHRHLLLKNYLILKIVLNSTNGIELRQFRYYMHRKERIEHGYNNHLIFRTNIKIIWKFILKLICFLNTAVLLFCPWRFYKDMDKHKIIKKYFLENMTFLKTRLDFIILFFPKCCEETI